MAFAAFRAGIHCTLKKPDRVTPGQTTGLSFEVGNYSILRKSTCKLEPDKVSAVQKLVQTSGLSLSHFQPSDSQMSDSVFAKVRRRRARKLYLY